MRVINAGQEAVATAVDPASLTTEGSVSELVTQASATCAGAADWSTSFSRMKPRRTGSTSVPTHTQIG